MGFGGRGSATLGFESRLGFLVAARVPQTPFFSPASPLRWVSRLLLVLMARRAGGCGAFRRWLVVVFLFRGGEVSSLTTFRFEITLALLRPVDGLPV